MNDDNGIRIQPLTRCHRETLLGMYRSFDPLGLACGLPPRSEDGRRSWIDGALQQEINLGAFATEDLVGHSFLAVTGAVEAEVAFFVKPQYRRRGIGTALLKALLQWTERTGLRRIWAMSASEPETNVLKRCGFRFARYVFPAVELDIPAACAGRKVT